MNINEKILKKLLANGTQNYMKKIMNHQYIPTSSGKIKETIQVLGRAERNRNSYTLLVESIKITTTMEKFGTVS